VVLDVSSRYVVGWMVAHREAATLANRLLAQTLAAQAITDSQLTVHADRGSSMTSKPVALLLADLGVTRSHSHSHSRPRPHVPDVPDVPDSESQVKTLKHHPAFPDRFGCSQDARAFCQTFFSWHNAEHYHAGIGPLTPADVHFGRAAQLIAARQAVLSDADAAHPERFVRKPPEPPKLPEAVWINKPADQDPQEAPQQYPA
jgi:putative transposase